MQKFDKAYFDAGIKRQGTDCVKWDDMLAETGDPDMLPMWVADMDFPSPPAVADALRKTLDYGTWGYMHPGKADDDALIGYWKRNHGVEFARDSILMSPCVVTSLRLCVRALTKQDDGVLIFVPVYGPFYASIKENGRRTVEIPLKTDENNRYSMDFEAMDAALAAGEAQAVMICSPHNPCGRAWTQEEIAEVVRICIKYDVPLISDEIHADFVFAPNKHHTVLSVPGGRECAVMLCAASKTYNVAGLKQSSIVCENETMRKAIETELNACGAVSGNSFALAATCAAYTDCDEWLAGLKAYLMENRDFVCAYVTEKLPHIKVTPLDATYLMWLDCRALGVTQEALMERLAAAHVKLNDGLFFGELGRGFIRLNIGCPRAQVEEAMKRLSAALAK